jgi:tetratricopeptide (TPR) repeat protein
MPLRKPVDTVANAQKQVDASRTLHGDNHPVTLTALTNLARAYRDRGELHRAQQLLESVLVHRKQLDDDEGYDVLRVEGLLAGVISDLGDLVHAKRLQEHVLESFERKYVATHEATLIAMHNLSSTLFTLGEFDATIRLEERILIGESLREPAPSMHATLYAIARIGRARRALKQFQEAKELDETAIDKARALGDPALLVGAMRALLEDLAGLEEWDAALTLTRQMLQEAVRASDSDDDFVRELRRNKRKLERIVKHR